MMSLTLEGGYVKRRLGNAGRAGRGFLFAFGPCPEQMLLPLAYERLGKAVPLISASTCRASSWASTVGTRTGRVERTESMLPVFVCRTSWYTKDKALKAWFWVEPGMGNDGLVSSVGV